MTYPRTLRLTPDGVVIVVQRPTAQAVSTASRAAVGLMTLADVAELAEYWPPYRDKSTPTVVALSWWIAGALKLSAEMATACEAMSAKKGIPRG